MKITVKNFTQTPGIYVWTNTLNGKVYVGQAVNVCRRVQQELYNLRRGNFHNDHMQRAWDKYGEDAFIVGQVMECEVYELNDAEAAWGEHFDALNPEHGYNIRGYGNGKMADETIDKIREAHHAKYDHFEKVDEIMYYYNLGLNYTEIQKLTGANVNAVRIIVNENENMIENVKLTHVEAYEMVKAGIISAKKAAALGGFSGTKFFNTCFKKWMAENDN